MSKTKLRIVDHYGHIHHADLGGVGGTKEVVIPWELNYELHGGDSVKGTWKGHITIELA